MKTPDEPANTNRAAELVAAVANFKAELEMASTDFSMTDQVDSISQALNWISSRPRSRALFTSV
jgi:hypothetical protein